MIQKLLVIIVLVIVASLAIAGCTSSTSNPTATPSATSAATTGFDPLLVKMEHVLKAEYPSAYKWVETPKNESYPVDSFAFKYGNMPNITTVIVQNYSSPSDVSSYINATSALLMNTNQSELAPGLETHFGQQAATVALGHAPTTVQDVYIKTNFGDSEYIQYDNILVTIDYAGTLTAGA